MAGFGHGGGRVEGVTGVVGGTDTLLTILTSIPSLNAIPPWSRQHIIDALKTFQAAPATLAVDTTEVTDWTDSSGHLGQGVDLVSSSVPLANPRQLSFTWKAGQAPDNVWWELENRLSAEYAQGLDFWAGVWAALAVTLAVAALLLAGSTGRYLILRAVGDKPTPAPATSPPTSATPMSSQATSPTASTSPSSSPAPSPPPAASPTNSPATSTPPPPPG